MKKILITLSLIGLCYNANALVSYTLSPELVDGSTGWYSVTATGFVSDSTTGSVFSGTAGGGALGSAYATIKLPNVLAGSFQNATFSVTIGTVDMSVDSKLEILTISPSKAITNATYNIYDQIATTADNNFLSGTLVQGTTITTSAAALTNYLNSANYAANQYLIVRVSPNANPGGISRRVYLPTATLTFDAVPEPSTYALIAGSLVLGVCILRRSKKS